MSDLPTLLPPNAQKIEYDLEQLSGRITELPAPISTLWNVETCPLALLPWLGWAFSVEVWESEWSETVKRDVIRSAIDVHRRKGTKAAVIEALSALGIVSAISEWFEHGGDPHTFFLEFTATDILAAGYVLDRAFVDQVYSILETVKPVRSHYDVRVSEAVTNSVYVSPSFGELMIDDANMVMELP